MTKTEAIYQAFCEIVPFTKKEVTVRVEDDTDEYGNFVRVYFEKSVSSKVRYDNNIR